MNRNIIIGGVIIILIILGIWYYSSSKMTSTSVSTEVNDSQTNVKPGTPSTFKSIFAQSGNHQCLYEQVNPSNRSSSVIYISDGKMRGEFRTVTASSSIANIMIYTGGYLYSWREGATVGKKSSIKTIAELPQVIPDDLTSGAVFGTSMDNVSWDCHDWLKDLKMFVIPSSMTFSAS